MPHYLNKKMANRFRGFLPVVTDIETAGFNPSADALLEVAIVLLVLNEEGKIQPQKTHFCHVLPFPGAHLDPAALEFTQIDPYHPFRFAIPEAEALKEIFQPIQEALAQYRCQRAVLVGHNPSFDLSFISAASKRCQIASPFHPFTAFDTATLAGMAYGETVLAKACKAARIAFDPKQAHSAIYDAERTAELFCGIINRWPLH
jgi:ribonuclease T